MFPEESQHAELERRWPGEKAIADPDVALCCVNQIADVVMHVPASVGRQGGREGRRRPAELVRRRVHYCAVLAV